MCGWSLYRHRVWCDLANVGIKIHLSDRLRSFYTPCRPFNRYNIGSAGRNVDMNRFVSHFTNDTGFNDLLVHELMYRVLN